MLMQVRKLQENLPDIRIARIQHYLRTMNVFARYWSDDSHYVS